VIRSASSASSQTPPPASGRPPIAQDAHPAPVWGNLTSPASTNTAPSPGPRTATASTAAGPASTTTGGRAASGGGGSVVPIGAAALHIAAGHCFCAARIWQSV